MTTYTWNGSAGDYTDSARWSPNGVPGAGDTAVIGSGNVILPANNESFTGGQTILLSGGATLTTQVSAFFYRDTSILPADAASVATAKLVNQAGTTVDGGTLFVGVPTEGRGGGSGSFTIGVGTLEFGSSVDTAAVFLNGARTRFNPDTGLTGTSLLKLDRPAEFQGVIAPGLDAGFGIPVGSAIDLVGTAADSVAFAPSTAPNPYFTSTVMRVLDHGATAASLTVRFNSASGIPLGVAVVPDGAGGTLIRSELAASDDDTVQVPGPRSGYTVTPGAGATVVGGNDLTAYVTPGTALAFTDGTLSFWADEVYRLYEAALGRAPDEGGTSYWTKLLQDGVSLAAVADGFLRSPEYQGAGLTDERFVAQLYRNGLGRAPDAGGEAYWTGLLESGRSRAEVLAGLSGTDEVGGHNAAGIAAASAGVFYPTPSHGA